MNVQPQLIKGEGYEAVTINITKPQAMINLLHGSSMKFKDTMQNLEDQRKNGTKSADGWSNIAKQMIDIATDEHHRIREEIAFMHQIPIAAVPDATQLHILQKPQEVPEIDWRKMKHVVHHLYDIPRQHIREHIETPLKNGPHSFTLNGTTKKLHAKIWKITQDYNDIV